MIAFLTLHNFPNRDSRMRKTDDLCSKSRSTPFEHVHCIFSCITAFNCIHLSDSLFHFFSICLRSPAAVASSDGAVSARAWTLSTSF
jgi:hypothetical protein